MLDIHRADGPDTKFYFSHSVLPPYVDPQNVSTKKKPFSAFNTQPFTHTLDLVLPEEIYELVREQLQGYNGVYARVYMKLGELLEGGQGGFLGEYIKNGNIMMLSEGRPLVDNVFSLYEGILRLELDRLIYERCGLQGKPIEDGGKKHQKARWVVEYDLRASSMVHGKKGFSRLEWACKNVLNQSLTWLFYNFNPSSQESLAEGREPISVHHPFIHKIEPLVTRMPNVLAPQLTVADLTGLYDSEDSLVLHEYLSLLSLGSPRLNASDSTDPHLSRYDVPDFGNGLVTKDMVRVRWRGFIPPQFMRDLFLLVRREGLRVKKEVDVDDSTLMSEEERWFGLNAMAFGGKNASSVMQWAGRETMVWEVEV